MSFAGMDPSAGTSGLSGRYEMGTYANPSYTVAGQFLPRSFSDILKWSRFILVKSPTTTEVLRKLSTYPITDVTISTPKEALKDKYEDIFESIRLIEKLSDGGFDYHAFGNSFTSIYFPIDRYIECPSCKASYESRKALDRKFATWKKYEFVGECPSCSHSGVFKRTDIKSKDVSRINIVKWKPDNISINNNPLTGATDYYYKVPADVRRKIMTGDPHFICSVPWEMIEAVKLQRDFKFSDGVIHHMKSLSMGDFIDGFGVPPLLSHYSTVFYMECLKKANESIALEHMNPLRMLFPQQGSPSGDPLAMMSMGNFTGQVKKNLQKFKQDPNHILISPVPIGVGNLGGQGKSLLVTQELQFAEEQLMIALGVSRELLSGTTNWTSSAVGLRLLENNMNHYVRKLRRFLKWIVKQITAYLGLEEVEVDFVPFELTDNEALKNTMLQLQQQGLVSEETLLEASGLDFEKEIKRMTSAQVRKAETEVKLRALVERIKFTATRDEANTQKDDEGYEDYRKKIMQYASQIISEPDEAQKQQLKISLHTQDAELYEQVMEIVAKYTGGENEQSVQKKYSNSC